ncbi:hypothetical protein, conserved [Plasmodium gonderi]|uniref:C2H2-type domain-containing protein n=1 Tax=Plasmodium gonderi TaxID=77519 RepID=A0A1Y1JD45_PLAGO|nr:hypothetical protein, conserved [Plasmodium gonderi]GAW79255.1 hypothetical protein, conserved [Plasmodium gonderi]
MSKEWADALECRSKISLEDRREERGINNYELINEKIFVYRCRVCLLVFTCVHSFSNHVISENHRIKQLDSLMKEKFYNCLRCKYICFSIAKIIKHIELYNHGHNVLKKIKMNMMYNGVASCSCKTKCYTFYSQNKYCTNAENALLCEFKSGTNFSSLGEDRDFNYDCIYSHNQDNSQNHNRGNSQNDIPSVGIEYIPSEGEMSPRGNFLPQINAPNILNPFFPSYDSQSHTNEAFSDHPMIEFNRRKTLSFFLPITAEGSAQHKGRTMENDVSGSREVGKNIVDRSGSKIVDTGGLGDENISANNPMQVNRITSENNGTSMSCSQVGEQTKLSPICTDINKINNFNTILLNLEEQEAKNDSDNYRSNDKRNLLLHIYKNNYNLNNVQRNNSYYHVDNYNEKKCDSMEENGTQFSSSHLTLNKSNNFSERNFDPLKNYAYNPFENNSFNLFEKDMYNNVETFTDNTSFDIHHRDHNRSLENTTDMKKNTSSRSIYKDMKNDNYLYASNFCNMGGSCNTQGRSNIRRNSKQNKPPTYEPIFYNEKNNINDTFVSTLEKDILQTKGKTKTENENENTFHPSSIGSARGISSLITISEQQEKVALYNIPPDLRHDNRMDSNVMRLNGTRTNGDIRNRIQEGMQKEFNESRDEHKDQHQNQCGNLFGNQCENQYKNEYGNQCENQYKNERGNQYGNLCESQLNDFQYKEKTSCSDNVLKKHLGKNLTLHMYDCHASNTGDADTGVQKGSTVNVKGEKKKKNIGREKYWESLNDCLMSPDNVTPEILEKQKPSKVTFTKMNFTYREFKNYETSGSRQGIKDIDSLLLDKCWRSQMDKTSSDVYKCMSGMSQSFQGEKKYGGVEINKDSKIKKIYEIGKTDEIDEVEGICETDEGNEMDEKSGEPCTDKFVTLIDGGLTYIQEGRNKTITDANRKEDESDLLNRYHMMGSISSYSFNDLINETRYYTDLKNERDMRFVLDRGENFHSFKNPYDDFNYPRKSYNEEIMKDENDKREKLLNRNSYFNCVSTKDLYKDTNIEAQKDTSKMLKCVKNNDLNLGSFSMGNNFNSNNLNDKNRHTLVNRQPDNTIDNLNEMLFNNIYEGQFGEKNDCRTPRGIAILNEKRKSFIEEVGQLRKSIEDEEKESKNNKQNFRTINPYEQKFLRTNNFQEDRNNVYKNDIIKKENYFMKSNPSDTKNTYPDFKLVRTNEPGSLCTPNPGNHFDRSHFERSYFEKSHFNKSNSHKNDSDKRNFEKHPLDNHFKNRFNCSYQGKEDSSGDEKNQNFTSNLSKWQSKR